MKKAVVRTSRKILAITLLSILLCGIIPNVTYAMIQNPLDQITSMDGINAVYISIFDEMGCQFSKTLFNNGMHGGNNMSFWDSDVPKNIQDGIMDNATVRNRIDYVISKAKDKGTYKVDYISDGSNPSYNEPSFDETLKYQGVEFNSPEDLKLAIHGLNGRMVIQADSLGNSRTICNYA